MPFPIIAALAVSAAASLGQTFAGMSRANKAKKALQNYQRQELTNVTKGMRVSTLGAELQTQEAQRRFATSVDALQSGGIRGVVGGLGQIEQAQAQQQQAIAADLDRQQQQIEQARAQDEANIRGMQEQREQQDIAGLGSELADARQQTQAGLQGLASTAANAAFLGMQGGGGASASSGSNLSSSYLNSANAGAQAINSLSQSAKMPQFTFGANAQNPGVAYNGVLGALGNSRPQSLLTTGSSMINTPKMGQLDFSQNPFNN